MIRIGIVGCGRIAEHHLRFATTLKGCRVVGVVDQNLENATSLAQRYGIEHRYRTMPELLDLESLDTVHILTPPEAHYAQARMAIDRGVNVLIEKPVAFSATEVEDLYRRASANGVSVCPDFTNLFHPCMLKAIKLISGGELGSIVYCESNSSLSVRWDLGELSESVHLPWAFKLPGGILHNYITHPLYSVLYWVGEPRKVTVAPRCMGHLPQALTDHLEIAIEGKQASGVVTLSFGTRPGLSCLRVFCEKGTVVVNFETRTLTMECESSLPRMIQRATGGFRQAFQLCNDNIRNLSDGLRGRLAPFEGLRALLVAYYSSIRNHSDPPISQALALAVSRAEEEVVAQAGKVRLELRTQPSRQRSVRRPMRILITGATGYVGSEVAKQLIECGYFVRAFVRPLGRTEALEKLGVEITYGDLRDESALAESFRGMDLVIHLAAGLRGRRDFMLASCVTGTGNIAKAARHAGVKRVIYISSMSVYDFTALRKGAVITEETPLERSPASRGPAAMAKREAEDIALENLADKIAPWTIIRPSVIFGNGRDILFPLGVRMGKVVFCFGTKGTRLRLVHVKDVAAVILGTVRTPETAGRVFVVSHPESVTVHQYLKECVEKSSHSGIHLLSVPYFVASLGKSLANALHRLIGKGPRISKEQIKYLYSDVLVDSSAIRNQTGWQPSQKLLDQLATEAKAGRHQVEETAPPQPLVPRSRIGGGEKARAASRSF